MEYKICLLESYLKKIIHQRHSRPKRKQPNIFLIKDPKSAQIFEVTR